jgi:hypothetical protein
VALRRPPSEQQKLQDEKENPPKKRSLEDDMEQSQDPDEMVDQLLNDLGIPETEAEPTDGNLSDCYKKNRSSEPDLASIKTGSSASNLDSNTSRNSLLDMLNVKHVSAIEDHFKSLSEISAAIQAAGLERSQLIFGIDFTISNLENGVLTFNGRSLHNVDENLKNPYQKVIEILGKTLECFDVDGRIPAYGFGDIVTKDRKVFPFSVKYFLFNFYFLNLNH